MKNVIVQIFIMVFTILFFVFGIYYLYDGKIGEENGFFAGIGSVISGTTESPIVSDGINALQNTSNVTAPVVKYTGGARQVGTEVAFKELFEIALDGQTFIPATAENGFAVYFYDITDLEGTSVVEMLTTEDIDSLEEVPVAFLFDKELQVLHFCKSGTFCILVRIYTDQGAQYLYECVLPVEVE